MRWLSRLLFVLPAFGLFLVLAWALDGWHLLAAGITAVLAALIFGATVFQRPGLLLDPRRWVWFFAWLGVFLWECLKANVDVAYRVLHPDLPIEPGIVRIRTNLASDIGRMMLANSVTMTPGTLSVDLVEDRLYVHWIVVRSREEAEAKAQIVGRLERLLAKVFE